MNAETTGCVDPIRGYFYVPTALGRSKDINPPVPATISLNGLGFSTSVGGIYLLEKP